MSNGEPPSQASPASGCFLIGRNSRGNWVVLDSSGLHGGLFIDRTHALKYAMSENGNPARAVIMVPDVLELDLSARPCASELRQFHVGESPSDDQQTRRKRVA